MLFGEEHRGTLNSMSNLATVLSMQEKFKEAKNIHRKVLYCRESVLGDMHPDTLSIVGINCTEVKTVD
mgnify:CR=1 FL=1